MIIFQYQKISSIKFGQNVKEIKSKSFYFCDNLSGVLKLSHSLIKVGESAFAYCSKISHFANTENIVELGVEAFQGCSSIRIIKLTKIKIGSAYCLQHCTSLITLELRDLEEAHEYSLSGCTSLENLTVTGGNRLCFLYLVKEFCFANCKKSHPNIDVG